MRKRFKPSEHIEARRDPKGEEMGGGSRRDGRPKKVARVAEKEPLMGTDRLARKHGPARKQGPARTQGPAQKQGYCRAVHGNGKTRAG